MTHFDEGVCDDGCRVSDGLNEKNYDTLTISHLLQKEFQIADVSL